MPKHDMQNNQRDQNRSMQDTQRSKGPHDTNDRSGKQASQQDRQTPTRSPGRDEESRNRDSGSNR